MSEIVSSTCLERTWERIYLTELSMVKKQTESLVMHKLVILAVMYCLSVKCMKYKVMVW